MTPIEMELISADRTEVLRYLGYGPEAHPSSETERLLGEIMEQIPEFGPVRGLFTTVPVSGVTDAGVETQSGTIESSRLATVARHAEKLVFGLVTAGEEIDRRADQSPDMVESCLWDAVGTVLAEEGVNRLMNRIEEETGQSLSLPFSPGYCDWPLSGQPVIFSAFDANPLGIRLYSDTFVMSPRKSVSFTACLGVTGSHRNPCRHCTLKNCFMRRT